MLVTITGTRCYAMFTRILTDVERHETRKYLKEDGARDITIRKLVFRAKNHLPKIREGLRTLGEVAANLRTREGQEG